MFLFSVGIISRYLQAPRKTHLEASKNIMKCVNSTLDMALLFKVGVDFSICRFTYANFGGDLDDRKSTSKYVFLYGDTIISWCSKKHDV